jgi:DNA-binding NarL/FixJ family response regulator
MDTKVFIIEDNPYLRETMVELMACLDGMVHCGDAGGGEEALEKLEGITPDIILVDGSLPGMSGEDFVREMKIRKPEIPCLFFSGRDEPHFVRSALAAGACGYVVKGGKPEELVEAVASCVAGGSYVSPSVSGWKQAPVAAGQDS